MRDNHIFSKSYTERKQAVIKAIHREELIEKKSNTYFTSKLSFKILVSVVILAILSSSVYAAVQWIEVRMEKKGNEVLFHAGINVSAEAALDLSDKPLRSWNSKEGEISIRLNIPDLPSDMKERENTNGKYYSEDSSRGMTINGIDLRRSNLDEIIGGADEVKQLDVGGKAMYVIASDSEAAYFNRTVFIVFEKEELVLKLWVSYGITDDELIAMASTLTLEETTDELTAIPIINEVSDDSYDWTTPHYVEREPVYESDLLDIGESARGASDYYTATVNSVEVYDNVNVLNPNCITRKDFVNRFIDDAGNLVPYNRTEIIFTQEGEYWTQHFGESVPTTKKLYVVTLTMDDITMDSVDEDDRDEMLKACVNGFYLNSYKIVDDEIEIISSSNVVVDKKPEAHADFSESIYREYLGNNQWKVAYLVDGSIAEEPLVLWTYTGKIYVKIQ